MIVTYNSSKYAELFAEAEDILNSNGYTGTKIDNIDAYFGAIEKLGQLVQTNKADPKLLILPTEDNEPFFEINANSRKIIIPDSFAKNGVAVEGDNMAEVLYFKIDRYFDTTDLFEQTAIIQATTPSTGTNLYATINKTLNASAGYVVFGWPISEELTQEAGNIQFNVRFYSVKTDEETGKDYLSYNFNTLPSIIKVNKGINEIEGIPGEDLAVLIDKSLQYYKNLKDSTITADVDLLDPIFYYYSPSGGTEVDFVNNILTLKASAQADPNGDQLILNPIIYAWHSNASGSDISFTGAEEYIKATSPIVKNRVYFKAVEGKTKSITYTPWPITSDDFDINNAYEKIAVFTLDMNNTPNNWVGNKFIGDYWVEGANVIGIHDKKVNSTHWVVPGAELAEVSLGDSRVSYYKGEDTALDINANISMVARDKNTVKAYLYYTDNQKATLDDIKAVEPIEYAINGNNIVIKDALANLGTYFLAVETERNKDIKLSTLLTPIRFTEKAKAFTSNDIIITDAEGAVNGINGEQVKGVISIVLNPSSTTLTDNQRYQWYSDVATDDLTPIEGATTNSYDTTGKSGNFRCEITNVFNNSEAVYSTPVYYVINK